MSADGTFLPLLAKLTESLEITSAGLPTAETLIPPANGISLLDTKTDLFLSYLQHLTFLIIVKLRGISNVDADSESLDGQVVKKLVELRVYLERGVRPLETKLKYQIDKVLRAAESTVQRANGTAKKNVKAHKEGSSSEESGSDAEIDELSYRPNIAALRAPGEARPAASRTESATKSASNTDGIYRPPRVNPTALPTTDADMRERERQRRRPARSSAVDEFVSAEMSGAPTAEPSIGSTIVDSGRRMKTARERNVEDERTRYEEANFMRLAPESKKDRKKREGLARSNFGGEELGALGEAGDRISRLTGRKRSGGDGYGIGRNSGSGGKKRRMGR